MVEHGVPKEVWSALFAAIATPLVGGIAAYLVQLIDRAQSQKKQLDLHLQRVTLIEKLLGVGEKLAAATGEDVDVSALREEFDELVRTTRFSPPAPGLMLAPAAPSPVLGIAAPSPAPPPPKRRFSLAWLFLPAPKTFQGGILTFLYYVYILLGLVCVAVFTAVAFMPDTKYPNEELGLHIAAVIIGVIAVAGISWVAVLCRHWALRNHDRALASERLRTG